MFICSCNIGDIIVSSVYVYSKIFVHNLSTVNVYNKIFVHNSSTVNSRLSIVVLNGMVAYTVSVCMLDNTPHHN